MVSRGGEALAQPPVSPLPPPQVRGSASERSSAASGGLQPATEGLTRFRRGRRSAWAEDSLAGAPSTAPEPPARRERAAPRPAPLCKEAPGARPPAAFVAAIRLCSGPVRINKPITQNGRLGFIYVDSGWGTPEGTINTARPLGPTPPRGPLAQSPCPPPPWPALWSVECEHNYSRTTHCGFQAHLFHFSDGKSGKGRLSLTCKMGRRIPKRQFR